MDVISQARDAISMAKNNGVEVNKDVDFFKAQLPKQFRKLPEETINYVNRVLNEEPELKEDLISYTKVLDGGKWSVKEYVNAVRFVSYQMMGYTNYDAYTKVFPKHLGSEYLDRYVNKYNKSKLVTELHKLVIVPEYLTHIHLRNKALKVQVDLMDSAKSEMVKHLASKTILELTAPPEENHLQVDVNIKKDDSIQAIEEALYNTASTLVKGIENKHISTTDVLDTDIIEVDHE